MGYQMDFGRMTIPPGVEKRGGKNIRLFLIFAHPVVLFWHIMDEFFICHNSWKTKSSFVFTVTPFFVITISNQRKPQIWSKITHHRQHHIFSKCHYFNFIIEVKKSLSYYWSYKIIFELVIISIGFRNISVDWTQQSSETLLNNSYALKMHRLRTKLA